MKVGTDCLIRSVGITLSRDDLTSYKHAIKGNFLNWDRASRREGLDRTKREINTLGKEKRNFEMYGEGMMAGKGKFPE